MFSTEQGGGGMPLVITALSAILPALLLLWFFSGRDRFPEPAKVIWATFGLGVLTIIPAALIETGLESIGHGLTGIAWAAYTAFIVAGLVEELFKLSVLQVYSFRSRHFNEAMDGVVYGAASGLGFATLENIFYVFSPDGGVAVSILRALLSVPGHALWGAVLGFYAGAGRLCGRPLLGSLKGLAAAVALHGIYDLPVMIISQAPDAFDPALGILLLLVILGVSTVGWIWIIRLTGRLRKRQAELARAAAATAEAPSSGPLPGIPAEDPERGAIPCAHHGSARFAGYLLVTIAALLLAWALVVVLALLFTPGDPAELFLGGVIVGGLPGLVGVFMLAGGIRKLKRAG